MRMRLLTLLSLAPLLSACAVVDLNAVPEAKAGCVESSTEELRLPSAAMLPGRRCGSCHRPGGQAGGLDWTAAGTVFESANSPCNSGGVRDAVVQFYTDPANPEGSTVMKLTTNRTGNFFTADSLGNKALRIRVIKNGKVASMGMSLSPQDGAIDCAQCHQPSSPFGAPGRVFLAP